MEESCCNVFLDAKHYLEKELEMDLRKFRGLVVRNLPKPVPFQRLRRNFVLCYAVDILDLPIFNRQ